MKIDTPLKKIINKMNSMCIATVASCCGFNYRGQDKGKVHSVRLYIQFDAGAFIDLCALQNKVCEVDRDGRFAIEYCGRDESPNRFVLFATGNPRTALRILSRAFGLDWHYTKTAS